MSGMHSNAVAGQRTRISGSPFWGHCERSVETVGTGVETVKSIVETVETVGTGREKCGLISPLPVSTVSTVPTILLTVPTPVSTVPTLPPPRARKRTRGRMEMSARAEHVCMHRTVCTIPQVYDGYGHARFEMTVA